VTRFAPVREALLARALAEAPASVVRELGAQSVLARLDAWLSDELAVVGSHELATELRGICPVEGADVEDYLPCIATHRSGDRALLRIRFRGGDPRWAFVQWVAGEGEVRLLPTDLLERVAWASTAFVRLHPRAVRIWIASSATCAPAGEFAAIVGGKRLLGAPLASVVAANGPGLPASFHVESVAAAEVFDRYAAEYAAYLEAHPAATEWTHVEDTDAIRECEAHGGLFALRRGVETLGVVALRRDATRWFEGWCVVDALLFAAHRGNALAVPMHRAAYRLLDRRPGDFVWGTIDPRNAASMATARRLGREDLGGDWWVMSGTEVTAPDAM
jgi:hypothetical protein